MAAPKRTHLQVERDRAEIQQYHLRKMTIYQIVDLLNTAPEARRDYTVSYDMVKTDLEVLLKRWLATRDLAEDRAAQLAEVQEIKRTLWRAWEASQEDKEVTVQEQVKGPVGAPTRGGPLPSNERMKAQVRKEGQSGNPAFVTALLGALDREAKLTGTDAPTRVRISGSLATKDPADMNDAELAEFLADSAPDPHTAPRLSARAGGP